MKKKELKKGDFVKILRSHERFWVEVEDIGEFISGRVDNDLLNTEDHGLKLNDPIKFHYSDILDVMNA